MSFGKYSGEDMKNRIFVLTGILEIFTISGSMIFRIFGMVFVRKGNKN